MVYVPPSIVLITNDICIAKTCHFYCSTVLYCNTEYLPGHLHSQRPRLATRRTLLLLQTFRASAAVLYAAVGPSRWRTFQAALINSSRQCGYEHYFSSSSARAPSSVLTNLVPLARPCHEFPVLQLYNVWKKHMTPCTRLAPCLI